MQRQQSQNHRHLELGQNLSQLRRKVVSKEQQSIKNIKSQKSRVQSRISYKKSAKVVKFADQQICTTDQKIKQTKKISKTRCQTQVPEYQKQVKLKRVTFADCESETPSLNLNPFEQMVAKYKAILTAPDPKMTSKPEESQKDSMPDLSNVSNVRKSSSDDSDQMFSLGARISRKSASAPKIIRKGQKRCVTQKVQSDELLSSASLKKINKNQNNKNQQLILKSDAPQLKKSRKQNPDTAKMKMLRNGMNSLIENQVLPNDCLVTKVYQNLIGSYHFKKKIEQARQEELNKLLPKHEGFTEITFNAEDHGKALVGLFSRQFDVSYFQNLKAKKATDLFDDMSNQLFPKFSNQQLHDMVGLLHYGQNQLLIVYDTRKPLDIKGSKNRASVIQSQSITKPRMIGFAVFQQTNTQEPSGIFIHKIFGKQQRQQYKRKVLLALNTTQDNFRVQQMLTVVTKTDQNLYIKHDYEKTNRNQEILADVEFKMKPTSVMMALETHKKKRDIKSSYEYLELSELRKKAKKIEEGIEIYKKWIEINHKDLELRIKRSSKSTALKSDQAETPDWLMQQIKRFTHLSDKNILDVFIFKRNWNGQAFYDGFKKPWPKKIFPYVNSPFSQARAALKKCADFQASGGNCAIILPTICLWNNKLYEEALRFCTIRYDLPLFAFGGFKEPLMKHIVLLYFLQPQFANDLTIKKEAKVQYQEEFINEDNSRVKIIHYADHKKSGRNKLELTDDEKQKIVKMYLAGKRINFIRIKLYRRDASIRSYLMEYFGKDVILEEQDARSKGRTTDRLTEFLEKEQN